MTVHRNQFIISEAPYRREDFHSIRICGGLHLSYQEDLSVLDVSNRSAQRIVFLGEAVDTLMEGREVADMLSHSRDLDLTALFELVFPLSGRWVLILDDIVISDPCSLLAVFYAEDAPVISSSLALIYEHTQFSQTDADAGELVFEKAPDWYPVPLTRLKGIFRKLAHQYLKLSNKACKAVFRYQFEPERFTGRSKEDILEQFVAQFDVFFKNAHRRYGQLVLPLTSGVDSRTLFALACHSGVKFRTMTLDYNCTKADREVPGRISSVYGIEHSLEKALHPPVEDVLELWDRHTFKSSVSIDRVFLSSGQFDNIPEGALLLRGNLWEIVSFYWDYKYRDAQTREDILNSIYQGTPGFMTGRFNSESMGIWIDDVLSNPRKMGWRESLFFEQRQSGWLGCVEQGLDLTDYRHFQPLCSAMLLSMLFALDKSERIGRHFQKELISNILPDISKVPYNAKTVSERILKYWSKIRKLKTFGEIEAALRKRLG